MFSVASVFQNILLSLTRWTGTHDDMTKERSRDEGMFGWFVVCK